MVSVLYSVFLPTYLPKKFVSSMRSSIQPRGWSVAAELGGFGSSGAAATDVMARAATAKCETGAISVGGKCMDRLGGTIVSA